jgi:galactose mutarotase-like enzyme
VSAGGGTAERKRGICFEPQFVADAGNNAGGEVGIGEANDFKDIGAGEVVSAFDEFGRGQLEHF